MDQVLSHATLPKKSEIIFAASHNNFVKSVIILVPPFLLSPGFAPASKNIVIVVFANYFYPPITGNRCGYT